MSFFREPPILSGRYVDLVALSAKHARGLYAIGTDPTIWRWLPESEFSTEHDAKRFVEKALANKKRGDEFPFAIIERKTGKVVGTTRYMEIREADKGLEVGWTWYGTEFQRTGINTDAKLLLMQYAFEELGAIRLQLKTDSRNLRSQNAIQRVGGKFEGTLRNHRILPKDGFLRDTVYFSIIDTEWPEVKKMLLELLR
jgi:RimJ/RimL family protein N-acetyltransferase